MRKIYSLLALLSIYVTTSAVSGVSRLGMYQKKESEALEKFRKY